MFRIVSALESLISPHFGSTLCSRSANPLGIIQRVKMAHSAPLSEDNLDFRNAHAMSAIMRWCAVTEGKANTVTNTEKLYYVLTSLRRIPLSTSAENLQRSNKLTVRKWNKSLNPHSAIADDAQGHS